MESMEFSTRQESRLHRRDRGRIHTRNRSKCIDDVIEMPLKQPERGARDQPEGSSVDKQKSLKLLDFVSRILEHSAMLPKALGDACCPEDYAAFELLPSMFLKS